VLAVAALAGLGARPAASQGQTAFPSKPIKLICPYGAGGPVDVVGRYMGACVQRGFGDSVPAVMENIPGAAGITGAMHVLRAPSDGHTLLAQVTSALLTTQLLNPNAGYDAQTDFVPIWGLASLGTVILVGGQSRYRSIQDLVDAAKAQPGRLTYGSAGVGSNPHINTETFARSTGIRMTHVPYKSSGAAIADLIGGHIDCFFAAIASSLQLINEGRVRGLAVLRSGRVDEISQVPTFRETGLGDWRPPPAIFALYAASQVPAAVRNQVAAAAQKGLEGDSQSAQTLRKLGMTGAISGAALLDTVHGESSLLRKTMADAGISVGR
jgi:tripartite-type tricarboxylate transporter receptor subunit TctC